MPENTPLHELTGAQLDSLCPRLWDGEAEYYLLSSSVLPRPPGSTWSGVMMLDFPITFPAYKRQFLTTLLMQYTLRRQQCTACGVPALEAHADDDMVFVTQSTQTKTRKHQRRPKDAPDDDPWETYSTLEWENVRTPTPGGYHYKYADFNTAVSYPACTVEETEPDPPEGWDGEDLTELPDYEDFDWRIIDEPDELSDDTIISYADLVGACIAGFKEQLQSRQRTSQFTPRKAYFAGYHIPLQGFAFAEDMSAAVIGGEASAYEWTAHLWATGQRIPFKLVYTQKITWLYDNEDHTTGEVFSEEQQEIIFSHGSGWHHELSPPLLVGRKTALYPAYIEIHNP